tara:strand:- start:2121 stop:2279 length:159 start_codon:yes stop_codon:yes gene_type:complete
LKKEDHEKLLQGLTQIQADLAEYIGDTTGMNANQHIKRAERAVRAALETLKP